MCKWYQIRDVFFNSSQNSTNAIENISEIYLNHSVVRWRVLEVNLASINSCLNPTRDTEAQLTGASNWGMVLGHGGRCIRGRCIWGHFFLNMQPKMIRYTSLHFLVRAVSFAPKMRGRITGGVLPSRMKVTRLTVGKIGEMYLCPWLMD